MLFWQQQKGGAGVAVPVHAELRQALLRLPDDQAAGPHVFPAIHGKAGSGKSGLSETFKRIMVKAEIQLEKRLEAAGGAGRGRNKLSFHSPRHTLNSLMANAGVAEEVRQKITGHHDAKSNLIFFEDLRLGVDQTKVAEVVALERRQERARVETDVGRTGDQ